MAHFSESRGKVLLSLKECAEVFNVSERTIRRKLEEPGVYTELVPSTRIDGHGGQLERYLDPDTLSLTSVCEQPSPVVKARDASYVVSRDLAKGHRRLSLIQPALELSGSDRQEAITRITESGGPSERTIRRWIRSYELGGLAALSPKQSRTDRGSFRVEPDTYSVILSAIVSNPQETSARRLHRVLIGAVPELMRKDDGKFISYDTVLRIRTAAMEDPVLRGLFANEDARKEWIRAYSGEVIAPHANYLWQMDMTRCDTEVVEVAEDGTATFFRPRIHAIIDIYSGAVPGIVFSRAEDQTQTDLVIGRALLPKPAPFTGIWDAWGTPIRLHADNGKTYVSDQAKRLCASFGIELIHSRIRVSHTRGKIERFFGTFHGFERTLPGYVGPNAVARSTEELKRLRRNTENWIARGMTNDPGWGNRLLTHEEYRDRALAWLLTEYHSWEIDGMSRMEHFVTTAPAATRRTYDPDDFNILFWRRDSRVVRPNGSVQFANTEWTLADGTLINYVGLKILVLTNQFAIGSPSHTLAHEDRSGALRILGTAIPMPQRADSPEAHAHRLASEAAARQFLREGKREAAQLSDPRLVVSNHHLNQLQAELKVPIQSDPPGPRARLEAIEGRAVFDQDDDDFTKSLGELPFDGDDPKAYLEAVVKHHQTLHGGKRK